MLPEGRSIERFRWLEKWVADPADIVRIPGTESNVKEIYNECALLAEDPTNVVINQFSEFGNYLVHYHCTGPALARIFDHLSSDAPHLRLAAFVAGTGSAGTIAAGDYLARRRGVPQQAIGQLSSLGLSGIANVLAAIKYARQPDLEADDVVLTVATDNAALYDS